MNMLDISRAMRSGEVIPRKEQIKLVISLSIPAILEQLVMTLMSYIDTAMVGTLGTQATAAVGATGTVSWLVGSTVSAVGVGFLALISQSYGAGDKERAKRASAQSCLAVLVLGVLLVKQLPKIPYFRNRLAS